MKKNYKIIVVGLGYVGLSNALILAQTNKVIGVDTSEDRVNLVKSKKSPFDDPELSHWLTTKELDFEVTTDLATSLSSADYVIICTPTNFDESTGSFDTSSVETIISYVNESTSNACIVIKSTIPIGFVDDMKGRFRNNEIIFSPEFLREGRALHDNLYPSRIIVGDTSTKAKIFADLLVSSSRKDNVDLLFTGSHEAECIKLFSNTYLAMRVAFFNELDSYTLSKKLNTQDIIEGVCKDPRIGMYYNNPSFGYGGYCLPKDTQQLLFNYKDIPQSLIGAVIASNKTRKKILSGHIIDQRPKSVGIYRLLAKNGTDNFRESAVLDIIEEIRHSGIKVFIYEPGYISGPLEEKYEFIYDIKKFKEISDIIICNRYSHELEDARLKLFTRDIFGSD